MSAVDLALARYEKEEGFRAYAYLDKDGHLTIGYGFRLGAGLTKFAGDALARAQLTERAKAMVEYPWFNGLDDVRTAVLLDLSMNDGLSGLLHFVKMIAAIGDKNWQVAHDELLNSKAAKSLPTRYAALAQVLLTGVA